MKRLILTVCNGNIHRSVIAEAVIRSGLMARNLGRSHDVMSRGIAGTCGTPAPTGGNIRDYPSEWRLTSLALEGTGTKIPARKVATPITRKVAERASLILAMDDSVLRQRPNSLYRQFPDLTGKMHLFSVLAGEATDIPDLFRKNDQELYARVIGRIRSTIEGNFETLLRLANA